MEINATLLYLLYLQIHKSSKMLTIITRCLILEMFQLNGELFSNWYYTTTHFVSAFCIRLSTQCVLFLQQVFLPQF